MDDVIQEGGQLIGQAIAGVTNSDNNWAAIILLVALLGVLGIVFQVARTEMAERSKRLVERETQMRRDFEEQLQNQRVTQDFIARMNDRYDATLNRVTEAFGETSAIIRQAKEEIRRNGAALDRNTAMLEKFVPTLPKRSSKRKPAAVVERTVTVETKATAEVEAGNG